MFEGQPLNLPNTDPLGVVYRIGSGRYCRAIFSEKTDYVRKVVAGASFDRLMAQGLFARTWISDVEVPGATLVTETQAAPFDIPCQRFSWQTYKRCALNWLKANLVLMDDGYFLSDAHFGNFMIYADNQPKMIDLGSIYPLDAMPQSPVFPGYEFFVQGLLAPLLMLSKGGGMARLARLSIADAPYNGPLHADNDHLADLRLLIGAELDAIYERVADLTATGALSAHIDLVGQLSLPSENNEEEVARETARAIPPDLLVALGSDCESVACVGYEAYVLTAPWRGNKACSVIEGRQRYVDALEVLLDDADDERVVGIEYANILNRAYLESCEVHSLVVAYLPFELCRHRSSTMEVNIINALSRLSHDRLLFCVSVVDLGATREALQDYFSVEHETTISGVAWLYCRIR